MLAIALLGLLASVATAHDAAIPGLRVYRTEPEPTSFVDRRDDNSSRDVLACVGSAASLLIIPQPTNSAWSSWAATAMSTIKTDCGVTLPATLTSDYLEYYSAASQWAETVESKAKQMTNNCGIEGLGMSFEQSCTQIEMVARASDNKTSTKTMAPIAFPHEVVIGGPSTSTPIGNVADGNEEKGSKGGKSGAMSNVVVDFRIIGGLVLFLAAVLAL